MKGDRFKIGDDVFYSKEYKSKGIISYKIIDVNYNYKVGMDCYEFSNGNTYIGDGTYLHSTIKEAKDFVMYNFIDTFLAKQIYELQDNLNEIDSIISDLKDKFSDLSDKVSLLEDLSIKVKRIEEDNK